MKSLVLLTTILLGPAPALSHEFQVGNLVIDHPWSRATPPNAKVGAGYLTITNTGAENDWFSGGSTASAERLEIHISEATDGVMRMRPAVKGIEIPAGSTVTLGPGGTHAMLVNLVRPLSEGEKVVATLAFEKAGSVLVEFKVESLTYRPSSGEDAASGHGRHKADQ